MVVSAIMNPEHAGVQIPKVQAAGMAGCATPPTTAAPNRAISKPSHPDPRFKVINHRGGDYRSGSHRGRQLTRGAQIFNAPNSTAVLENYGGTPCGQQTDRAATTGSSPVL